MRFAWNMFFEALGLLALAVLAVAVVLAFSYVVLEVLAPVFVEPLLGAGG